VFLNLLANAVQACARGVTVVARTRSDPEAAETQVEIEDDGCGNSSAHLSRIFDPFFTTKPVGQGTGLGLSISYGIVREHGGVLEAESEPGRGSTFRVRLLVRRAGYRATEETASP
jgi:signal transduction histidine kinase